jgi:hypothetical protein
MPQWVKLSHGWVNLDHAAYVSAAPDGVGLHEGLGQGTHDAYYTGADAEAIRAYLEQAAGKRQAPAPRYRRAARQE